jgi:hypothetical protein
MTVRQIIQVARHDERLNVYTTFEEKTIYFSWSGNKIVITTEEANQFANWLLQQTAEIEKRKNPK